MTQSISQRFIAAVGPSRDKLYAELRLRAGLVSGKTARGAEGLLLQAIHVVFEKYAGPESDAREIPGAIAGQLDQIAPRVAEPRSREGGPDGVPVEVGEATEPEPMPADVWARLTAAVQMEAAKLPGGPILNPDSVLLNPDPLLAPGKTSQMMN